MQERDREGFMVAIQALASSFKTEATPALLEGYWMGLEDLPIERVRAAIGQAIRVAKFMPVPAELREIAGDVPVAVRAVKAWDAVRRAIRAHGAYASIDFDDAAINATIRHLGGWQELCGKETEELDKWTRKDFEKAYPQYYGYGFSDEQGKPLVGIHEQTNSANGYPVSPPIQVITGLPEPETPKLPSGPQVPRLRGRA